MEPFYGGYATEEECRQQIAGTYERTGYVMDTHTAVAAAVYAQYREKTQDATKTVIASTASPYKFAPSILEAIRPMFAPAKNVMDIQSAFACVDELTRISDMKIPAAVDELRQAPILHKRICTVPGMKETVKEILGL